MKFHTKIRDCFELESFRKNLLPGAVAAMLLTPGAATALPMYTITDLGNLPDGNLSSSAVGINNHGQVVGTGFTITGDFRAVLYQDGVVTDLGALPGGFRSQASGINDHGQVVGTGFTITGDFRPFLWQSGVGMTDLGDLPGGLLDLGAAYGINDSGQVAGYSTAVNGVRAFLWDSASGMTDLGDLPGGFDYSQANAINDGGQVVGYSEAATGVRAFLWDSASGMTDLGDLPGGPDQSVAYGINNSGQVVGHSTAATGERAFLWDNASGMTDLGDLPGGNDYSAASDINDSGQVVGFSYAATGSRAFLWDNVNGMLDLNDLLIDADGWNLSDARAINASGQIAGNGYHNGSNHGFLLTPVDAGPQTEVIAPGVLAPSILEAVEENKITMQPGLFQSFSDSGFIDGVDGEAGEEDNFDHANETYVLVHGWNGQDSFGTANKDSLDPLWVTGMASEIRQKDPNANILAWNWTQFADSQAPDSIGDLAACQIDGGGGDCGIVPVNQVYMQDRNLARIFEQLYTGFADEIGDVQFLGHSLGGAIAANAANFLATKPMAVDRLTLFDPPENYAATQLGGKVSLDSVLPQIMRKSPGVTIENYTADGFASDPLTGYGISYADVANTQLLGHTHFDSSFTLTPMEWYEPTVSPTGGRIVRERGLSEFGLSSRGLNEDDQDLQDRYDQTWANLNPFTPYLLSRVGDYVERATEAVLETWHTLKVLGAAAVDGITDAVVYIGETTITVVEKTVSAISGFAEDVKVEASELGDWLSDGVAKFIPDWGLSLFSNSPSYAYRTLHIPETADAIYFEFMPQVWALGDSYIILFDDDVLYRIDGEFFENAWMDTGFLDVSRWAGQDVLLTIGLLSDEAGHQITTGGFGFTSRVAARVNSVPEPGTLFLFGIGLLGLIGIRLRWVGRVQKWAA